MIEAAAAGPLAMEYPSAYTKHAQSEPKAEW